MSGGTAGHTSAIRAAVPSRNFRMTRTRTMVGGHYATKLRRSAVADQPHPGGFTRRSRQRAALCSRVRPPTRPGSPAVQHRYLQTKFLIALIGFLELSALSWRSEGFRSTATLGSFCFGGVSAITMAQ